MMATKNEFRPMAKIEPTLVEYHIHHVVSMFQIRNASQAYQNIPFLLWSPRYCCTKKSGTNPIKTSGLNPFSGHEMASKTPDKIDKSNK